MQSHTLEDEFQQAAKIPGAKIFAVMRPLVHKGLSFNIVAPEITGNAKKLFFTGVFLIRELKQGQTRLQRGCDQKI